MIQVETISNGTGVPFKTYPHHWISVRFKVTGGTGSYQYRRNINNTPADENSWQNWTDIKADNYAGDENWFGYPIDTYWWHQIMPIEVRDKNNPTDKWSNHLFELFYNNNLTAAPMGDTPYINDANIAVGATSLTVKTKKINSKVRLYKSTYSSDGNGGMGQNFPPLAKPFLEGISDATGTIVFTIPAAVAGERYCATAKSFSEFDSIPCNYIEVAGVKKVNLQTTFIYGNKTATGRLITVTQVTGGSGNYQIGLFNNGVFDKTVGVAFEIPFFLSNIFIRDTGSVDMHVSVSVDGGANTVGTSYYGGLRERFNDSNNPNGAVTWGMLLQNNTFQVLDHYGLHDGRQGWGKNGYDFPNIGIDDTNLSTARVFFHPAGNVGGSRDFQPLARACARYIAQASGVMNIDGNSVRPTQTSNPWANPPKTSLSSRFQIIQNNNVVYEKIHTVQNEVTTFSISLNVTSQDNIYFVVDSYDADADAGDNSFDHVHIDARWSLVANSVGSTPPAPVITTELSDIPVVLPSAAIGTKITGTGTITGDYAIMYLDGFPECIGRNTASGFVLDGAMFAGRWTARTSRNRLLSDASNEIIISSASSPNPLPPTPASTTVYFGNNITGIVNMQGFVRTYKGTSLELWSVLPTVKVGNDWTFVFTPPEIEVYKLKLLSLDGKLSDYSVSVNVVAQVQEGIKILAESDIIGECEGTGVEYSFSETITDAQDANLVWSKTIIIPSEGNHRYFARLEDDHSETFVSELINSSLITAENWYNLFE